MAERLAARRARGGSLPTRSSCRARRCGASSRSSWRAVTASAPTSSLPTSRAGCGRRSRARRARRRRESPFDPVQLVWRMYDALTARPWRVTRGWTRTWRPPTTRRATSCSPARRPVRPVRRLPPGLASTPGRAARSTSAEGSPRRPIRPGRPSSGRPRAATSRGGAGAAGFVAALQARGAALVADGTLPAELHVFALPAIAPLHLGLLQALGACTEVHVYALNPCREYWFEIVEPRRLAHSRRAAVPGTTRSATGCLAHGASRRRPASRCSSTPVAARRRGRALRRRRRWRSRWGTTLLEHATRRSLEMRELRPRASPSGHRPRHRGPSPVTRSRANRRAAGPPLGLFSPPTTRRRRTILVVTPDLDAAAPLIDALFGTAPGTPIPTRSAGGGGRRCIGPARPSPNCSRSPVRAVRQAPCSACCSSRSSRAASAWTSMRSIAMRGWLQDAGVALGARRRALREPRPPGRRRPDFATGLARLLLGYALPTHAAEPFEGTRSRAAPSRARRTRPRSGAVALRRRPRGASARHRGGPVAAGRLDGTPDHARSPTSSSRPTTSSRRCRRCARRFGRSRANGC